MKTGSIGKFLAGGLWALLLVPAGWLPAIAPTVAVAAPGQKIYQLHILVEDMYQHRPVSGATVTVESYMFPVNAQVEVTGHSGRASFIAGPHPSTNCVGVQVNVSRGGYTSNGRTFNVCRDGQTEVIQLFRPEDARGPVPSFGGDPGLYAAPSAPVAEAFREEAITGTLAIISEPLGASVWIAGQPAATKTPLKVTLQAGEHEVVLKLDGAEIAEKVSVPMDEQVVLRVDFSGEFARMAAEREEARRAAERQSEAEERAREEARQQRAAGIRELAAAETAKGERLGMLELSYERIGSFAWRGGHHVSVWPDLYLEAERSQVRFCSAHEELRVRGNGYTIVEQDCLERPVNFGHYEVFAGGRNRQRIELFQYQKYFQCEKSPCDAKAPSDSRGSSTARLTSPRTASLFLEPGEYDLVSFLKINIMRRRAYSSNKIVNRLADAADTSTIAILPGKVLEARVRFDTATGSIAVARGNYRDYTAAESAALQKVIELEIEKGIKQLPAAP